MRIIDGFFVVLLIVVDQISKHFIKSVMQLNQAVEVIKDFFYIHYVQNDGMAFSLLAGQRWLFIVLTIVVIVFIIFYLTRYAKTQIEKAGLLLILSGAVGNLIDRIASGLVIDFLDFYISGYDFPVFNIADICITIGTGLLLIAIIFEKEK